MKLISKIEEVQAHVPVNMTSDIDTIKPFLSNIERLFIKDLIGKDQYEALIAAYAEETEDDQINEAILICQKIMANLAYHQGMPVLAVSIGTSGIQVISNLETKQAFQWQVEDLKQALQELGFSAIEELLQFLEENPDKFPDYINSPQFIKQESLLIQSAAEFSESFDINSSRFTFQKLTYLMNRLELQVIKKLFGDGFIEALKVDDQEGKYQTLLDEYIKPGLVLLTVAKGIIERIISIENGSAIINFKGTYNNLKESMAPNREQISAMYEQLEKDGNKFLQDGLEFITANLADFENFVPPVTRRRFKFTNDATKGVFGV